jgi:hypothetical protein
MARQAWLGLMAATALGGCAHVAAPDQGYAWMRADSPVEGAKLVLGAAEGTNDVLFMLACQPGSGVVDITAIGRKGDGAVIQLHAGKVWNRYPGAGQAEGESPGAVDIQLKLAAIDPVLQSFADTGEMTVVYAVRKVTLPNAFAPAHDFMNFCRRP